MRQQKRTKRESKASIKNEASGTKNESGTTNRGSTDKIVARLQTEIEVRIILEVSYILLLLLFPIALCAEWKCNQWRICNIYERCVCRCLLLNM